MVLIICQDFWGGALLTDPIWGLGNLAGLGLGLFFGWAENQYEEDYNRLLLDYMGTGSIYISDIDEDNMPRYNIEATIYGGLNTIGKPLACSIHTGIAVRVNDSHVFYDDCDMILNSHEIDSDSKYNASLDADIGTTYYLRPYIIVMIDGLATQTPLTRPPYLWGGKPQPLIKYGDIQSVCCNPDIAVTTGDYYDVTENSVMVECSFGKLPKNSVCGVKYAKDGEDFTFVSCANEEKVQRIPLSGLEPMTSYTYFACVEFDGELYCDDSKTFVTNPPDITGTWNCQQENWNSITQQTTYETYSITLKADGSVDCSYAESLTSSWTYSATGELHISIMDSATQSYNHGYEWTFKADDPKNPSSFTGAVYGWSYNINGYHSGDSHSCLMTK